MSNPLKEEMRQRLIAQYSGLFYKDTVERSELESAMKNILEEIIYRQRIVVPDQEKKKLVSEMTDELAGFGPIEQLIKDPDISEIMINGPHKIYIEKKGKKTLSNVKFDDEQQLRCLIFKLLAPTRRRADESYPFVDVSLKDGSRVNIILPPLALDGPSVTIRKFSADINTVENLITLGALDRRMADFLLA